MQKITDRRAERERLEAVLGGMSARRISRGAMAMNSPCGASAITRWPADCASADHHRWPRASVFAARFSAASRGKPDIARTGHDFRV